MEALEVPDKSSFLRLVRWRKRRWAPVNQSKIFFVPERKPRNEDELKELKTAYDQYHTRIKAIRTYLMHDLAKESHEKQDKSHVVEEARVFAELMEENKRWNQDTARIREARQAMETASRQEELMQTLIDLEEEQRRQKLSADTVVRDEKELAKTFIDVDRLDEEIEKALNVRINYNFAIDLEGNKYIEMSDGSIELESKTGDKQPEAMQS